MGGFLLWMALILMTALRYRNILVEVVAVAINNILFQANSSIQQSLEYLKQNILMEEVAVALIV